MIFSLDLIICGGDLCIWSFLLTVKGNLHPATAQQNNVCVAPSFNHWVLNGQFTCTAKKADFSKYHPDYCGYDGYYEAIKPQTNADGWSGPLGMVWLHFHNEAGRG